MGSNKENKQQPHIPVIESPIAMEWVISKKKLMNAPDECLRSKYAKASKIPGIRFCLSIFLHGPKKEEKNDQIWFYLHVQSDFESTRKAESTFTLSIKATHFKKTVQDNIFTVQKEDNPKGCGKNLLTRQELLDPKKKCFNSDDLLTVRMEGYLKIENGKKKIPICQPSAKLEKMYAASDKDLIITSKEEEVKVHKVLLIIASPIFKQQIEVLDGKFEIAIDASHVNALRIAIDFCYDRDVASRITLENAHEVLAFANKYEMIALKKLIETILLDRLTEGNVCKMANIASDHNLVELEENCIVILIHALEKGETVQEIRILCDGIHAEIGRRSFLYVCESL